MQLPNLLIPTAAPPTRKNRMQPPGMRRAEQVCFRLCLFIAILPLSDPFAVQDDRVLLLISSASTAYCISSSGPAPVWSARVPTGCIKNSSVGGFGCSLLGAAAALVAVREPLFRSLFSMGILV